MLQRALTTSMIAAWIAYGCLVNAQEAPQAPAAQEPTPSLAGASITDQKFDRNYGTLTFTLRNDSPTDLVAWVYTVTVQHATGRNPAMTTRTLTDEGMQHALATTPGLKSRPPHVGRSYLAAGKTREIVERLLPPIEHRVAPRTLENATVALSAVLFADGRATGDPNEVARIVDARKRQALESQGVLEALQRTRANKDANTLKQLRAAAKRLSKAASDLVEQAARQIELQPDATARERALDVLIEAYEVRQAVLTRAIVVQ